MSFDREFQRLRRQVRRSYCPIGFEEELLVDGISACVWKTQHHLQAEGDQNQRSYHPSLACDVHAILRARYESVVKWLLTDDGSQPSQTQVPEALRLKPSIPLRSARDEVADEAQLEWMVVRLESIQRRRRSPQGKELRFVLSNGWQENSAQKTKHESQDCSPGKVFPRQLELGSRKHLQSRRRGRNDRRFRSP